MSDNNDKKRAVALSYQPGEAPQVVAKGVGELAAEIVAMANEHGILVHEDEHLMAFLAQLDLGQSIPENLYRVIAELIAFSYVLQGKFPQGWEVPPGHFNTEA